MFLTNLFRSTFLERSRSIKEKKVHPIRRQFSRYKYSIIIGTFVFVTIYFDQKRTREYKAKKEKQESIQN
jgi:hypothetical protein